MGNGVKTRTLPVTADRREHDTYVSASWKKESVTVRVSPQIDAVVTSIQLKTAPADPLIHMPAHTTGCALSADSH